MKIFNVPGRGQTKENSLNCFGGNVFGRNSYVEVYAMLRIKVATSLYIYIYIHGMLIYSWDTFVPRRVQKKKNIHIYIRAYLLQVVSNSS